MKKQKVKWISLWPEFLVLLICGLILSAGISEKRGYHMDELLSFELANGEFNPWIVPTQPQGRLAKFIEKEIRTGEKSQIANWASAFADVVNNRKSSKLLTYQADIYEEPVWISADAFHRYITVDEEDAFNYLSVYFNVKDDNHPPLHFALLHTVSSLFQNQIFPWMGCAINLCFVLGCMVLLMRLGRQCMTLLEYPAQGKAVGLAAAILYGLSMGAFSTTLLIRMYAMLTFFCVALLTVHLDKLFYAKLGTCDFRNHNKLLIAVTVLGFWTQYFFLFYCLVLAAVTAVLLLRQKRTRELQAYIRNMLVAAIIGLALFPFAISDVFSSERGVEALENLSTGFSGYGQRLVSFMGIWLTGTGAVVVFYFLIVILLMAYAGRGNMKNTGGKNGFWPVLLIPVLGYFFLAARMSPYLVDRYIMPLFPFGVLLLTVTAAMLLGRSSLEEKAKRSVLWGTVALLACAQLFLSGRGNNQYLYPEYEKQLEVAKEYQQYPCICVYEGVGYYENLPEFEIYEKTLLVTQQELAGRKDKASISSLDKVVVLLKKADMQKSVTEDLKRYGLAYEETIWDGEGPQGDRILLFQKAK